MKLTVSFKHLEHTPALDERIREKSERLKKFFQGKLDVQWVCWVHEDEHWAEVKVHAGKTDVFAKASADNMYKSLDLAMAKIERQLEKQKNLKTDKLHLDHTEHPKYKDLEERMRDEEEFSSF